jgi:hypothetical protein
LEAEVLWNWKPDELLRPIKECAAELRVAIWTDLQIRSGLRTDIEGEDYQKILRIVYSRSDDPDKDAFSGKLQDAISRVESRIRPKLKNSHQQFDFLE